MTERHFHSGMIGRIFSLLIDDQRVEAGKQGLPKLFPGDQSQSRSSST
jgi:hypothetical protein